MRYRMKETNYPRAHRNIFNCTHVAHSRLLPHLECTRMGASWQRVVDFLDEASVSCTASMSPATCLIQDFAATPG